jgi:hypothetical protein
MLIKNNTSDKQMVHINQSDIMMAAEMWHSLRTIHEVHGQSAITATKCTFYYTCATDEDSILDHIAEMHCQANCINQMGCKISDEEFKSILTTSLPSNWDQFVSSYIGSHTKDGESITSQQLTSIILDEYHCHVDMNGHKESCDESFYAQPAANHTKKHKVMMANENPLAPNKEKCKICGKDNYPTYKCHFKGKPKCADCSMFGHTTEKCWGKNKPGKKFGKGKEKEKEHANIAQNEDAEMSYIASPNVTGMNEDSVFFYLWYADSGTTSHLTNERSAFIDYAPIAPTSIYGLGKSYVWAYGQGTIEVLSPKRGKFEPFYLKETLFTPDHPDNLMSIGRIDKSGGRIVFGNQKVILYNSNNNEVIKGDLSMNCLYPLEVYRRKDHTNSSNIATTHRQFTWDEWHRKYGHVGITGLKQIFTKKLVDGFEVDENSSMGDCDTCIQAKQSRALFPKKANF